MKIAAGIAATVYFAVTGFLLIWGGWLLATDDPDGGRHPVGAVMLVVAVVSGVLGLVSFRRPRAAPALLILALLPVALVAFFLGGAEPALLILALYPVAFVALLVRCWHG